LIEFDNQQWLTCQGSTIAFTLGQGKEYQAFPFSIRQLGRGRMPGK
jgi:hypothetical protein